MFLVDNNSFEALNSSNARAIVFSGISYGLSSGTDIDPSVMLSKNNIVTDESEIKSVGAGINMFGIMLLVAVVLIAWGSVKKATSK